MAFVETLDGSLIPYSQIEIIGPVHTNYKGKVVELTEGDRATVHTVSGAKHDIGEQEYYRLSTTIVPASPGFDLLLYCFNGDVSVHNVIAWSYRAQSDRLLAAVDAITVDGAHTCGNEKAIRFPNGEVYSAGLGRTFESVQAWMVEAEKCEQWLPKWLPKHIAMDLAREIAEEEQPSSLEPEPRS